MHRHLLFILAIAPFFLACEGWEYGTGAKDLGPEEPLRLSVLSTETCPLPVHLDPANVTIISYRVRLTSGHDGRVPANYFYASLLTTDGNRYLATFEGCSPVLSAEPLARGHSAEGFFNFPIPPSKVPDKLVFAPNLLDVPSTKSQIELSVTGSAQSVSKDSKLLDGDVGQ